MVQSFAITFLEPLQLLHFMAYFQALLFDNIESMNLRTFLLFLFFIYLSVGFTCYGQEVNNDELKRYAIALDSIETLKDALTVSLNKIAKGNSKISTKRYAVLIPIALNATKLSEAKATTDEIAYVKRATEIQREETFKFQKAYTTLISDYVGDSTFGKVRNALVKDTTLKKTYDSLMITLNR